MYLRRLSRPSRWAIWMVPMLEEFASTSVTVQCSVGMALGVVEGRACHLVAVRDGEDVGRLDGPGLQCSRDGDELVDRSRLVDAGESAGRRSLYRLGLGRPRAAPGRRIDADGNRRRLGVAGPWHGELGVGQDLARLGVHEQGDAIAGPGRHDRLRQSLLGVVLEGLVEAEHQIVACDRRPVLLDAARNLMAVGIDLGDGLASPA